MRDTMKQPTIALALFLSSWATGGGQGGPASGAAASVGGRLPALHLKALDGRDLADQTLVGKVVLLDVWASWCAPCKEELPILDRMASRLRPKGIAIVAISVDENRDDALAFLRDRGTNWSLVLAHDADQSVADRLRPSRMPTSYVVDRTGTIRFVNSGFERGDADRLEARLVELARQP